MADYGFKVAKSGKSITSTNPSDIIYSSQYATVKIVKQGYATLALSASGSGGWFVRHDLGYPPVALIYYEPIVGSGQWHCGFAADAISDDFDVWLDADPDRTYVTDTAAVLYFFNRTASPKTVKFYYFIFGNPN